MLKWCCSQFLDPLVPNHTFCGRRFDAPPGFYERTAVGSYPARFIIPIHWRSECYAKTTPKMVVSWCVWNLGKSLCDQTNTFMSMNNKLLCGHLNLLSTIFPLSPTRRGTNRCRAWCRCFASWSLRRTAPHQDPPTNIPWVNNTPYVMQSGNPQQIPENQPDFAWDVMKLYEVWILLMLKP